MVPIRTHYARLEDLPLDRATAQIVLSPSERASFATLRSQNRRDTWLAGRITAKRLLLQELKLVDHDLAGRTACELHIDSRSAVGQGERPLLIVDGIAQPFSISIAHSTRGVLAAVCLSDQVSLGVDLASLGTTSGGLDWTFTPAERLWLAGRSNPAATEQLWAGKEALYKACQRGEGFSPQAIEVVPSRLPVYPGFDAAHELLQLQSWRVDRQSAALAVVSRRPARAMRISSTQTWERAA